MSSIINRALRISKSSHDDIQRIKSILSFGNGDTVAITGAGISTDSGIPDYRGINGVYMRNRNYKPIQYHQFVDQHSYRQRYWARSFLGWPKFSDSKPNQSHFALTRLEKKGILSEIITQNVDRLHTKSGAQNVTELHGALHKVQCIGCQFSMNRDDFQLFLAEENPEIAEYLAMNLDSGSNDVASSEDSTNPDGDVEYCWDYDTFSYPCCIRCGSVMKPNVVFFGENMSTLIRKRSLAIIEKSKALIVIGSSLQVYSALRLVQHAHKRNIPIAMINLGPTRADALCNNKFELAASDILPEVDTAFTNIRSEIS